MMTERPPLIGSDIEYTCPYCMKTEPQSCDQEKCPMRKFPPPSPQPSASTSEKP